LRRRTARDQREEIAIIKKGCGTRENFDQDSTRDMAWACGRAREDESDGNKKMWQNREEDFSDVSTTSSESDESTIFAQETCAKDTSTTSSESEDSTVFDQDTCAKDTSTTSSEIDDSTVFAQDTCANDTHRRCIIKKLRGRQETAQIDLFLPQLNAWCQCKNCTRTILAHHAKYAEQNLCCLLRPWQVVFLAKQNIHTAGDLLQLKSRDAKQVCKSMVNWRKENGMDGHSKKACLVALHIWVRACALLKVVVEQSAEDTVPDLVEINLSEEEAGFSLLR
jgi:hypothetical protein